MKKIFSICLGIILLGSTSFLTAQTNSGNTTPKKLSYNFINEYGLYIGGDCGITGVFVNSMKFNRTNDLLGIGIGYELSINNGQSVPLFLNYRHYFDRGRKLQPLMNVAIGALLNYGAGYHCTTDEFGTEQCTSYSYFDTGLYATIASGFKVNAFSLSTGFFFRYLPFSEYGCSLTGGVEVKAGYTF